MLLVVDSSGTILPVATIVWGPGVVVTHRGNNVWRVSNLLAATEVANLATVIQSVTRERTVIRSVTQPATSFLTRTNTQRPWRTRNVTATVTIIQWRTVGSVIGGTRTHTRVLGTRTVTRPATVEATATKTVTKVVTVPFPFDCCCDCYKQSPGGGTINIACDVDAIGGCVVPGECLTASGDCTYNESVDSGDAPGGKTDACFPDTLAFRIYNYASDNCSTS